MPPWRITRPAKGFQVYLCGGPARLERDLAADIQRLSRSKPVDLVGQTNLKASCWR